MKKMAKGVSTRTDIFQLLLQPSTSVISQQRKMKNLHFTSPCMCTHCIHPPLMPAQMWCTMEWCSLNNNEVLENFRLKMWKRVSFYPFPFWSLLLLRHICIVNMRHEDNVNVLSMTLERHWTKICNKKESEFLYMPANMHILWSHTAMEWNFWWLESTMSGQSKIWKTGLWLVYKNSHFFVLSNHSREKNAGHKWDLKLFNFVFFREFRHDMNEVSQRPLNPF